MLILSRCHAQMVLIKTMMGLWMMKISCIAGFQEGSDTIKEEAFELLDGHDNNCDGLVAAVELDCDDDGSFPLVPGESMGFNRSAQFQMAADIGLEACSGVSTSLDCWENLSVWFVTH